MQVFLPNEAHGPPAQQAGTNPTENFKGAFWKGLPAEYQNTLLDLEHSWQQLTGYNVPVSEDDMVKMSHDRSLTLADFGQYMWTKMAPDLKTAMPWAEFGVSKDEFHELVLHFGSGFKALTGEDPSQDVIHQALARVGGSGVSSFYRFTADEWQQWLIHDQTMRDTYGWLKYGMDRQQFDTHKQEMRQSFGFDLSDKEATQQLQYFHAAAPDFYAASAQPTKQPSEPTLGASIAR